MILNSHNVKSLHLVHSTYSVPGTVKSFGYLTLLIITLLVEVVSITTLLLYRSGLRWKKVT